MTQVNGNPSLVARLMAWLVPFLAEIAFGTVLIVLSIMLVPQESWSERSPEEWAALYMKVFYGMAAIVGGMTVYIFIPRLCRFAMHRTPPAELTWNELAIGGLAGGALAYFILR